MSRKDFQALAAAFQAQRPSVLTQDPDALQVGAMAQWDDDVRAVADVCAGINPRFDYCKFLKACGGLFS